MSWFPGAKDASRQVPPSAGAAPLLYVPGMPAFSGGPPPPCSRGGGHPTAPLQLGDVRKPRTEGPSQLPTYTHPASRTGKRVLSSHRDYNTPSVPSPRPHTAFTPRNK